MLVKNLKKTILLLQLIFLGACSKAFVVVSEVPRPLVNASAISAQVNYSENFKTYEFIEKDEKRALEKVGFGAAQVDLFDRIFGSLFNLVKGEDQQAQLKIEPRVLDFQYAMPSETKSTQFEIWLKYRLIITDAQDQEVADWVVKGYGKTPTTLLGSHLKSFNTAANIALRDVGAQLAIGFRNQPSIKDYLEGTSTAISEPALLEGKPQSADETNDAADSDQGLTVLTPDKDIEESINEVDQ